MYVRVQELQSCLGVWLCSKSVWFRVYRFSGQVWGREELKTHRLIRDVTLKSVHLGALFPKEPCTQIVHT